MKRLALHVLLCLLTFSVGVEIQQLMTWKTQPATAPLITPRLYEPLPTNLFLTQSINTDFLVPSPRPTLILDYDSTKFDPYGGYSIVGAKPNGFSDFRGFYLDVYGKEDGEATVFVWISSTDPAGHRAFGLVTERRLIFATAPSKEGIVYRFEGAFLRRKVLADAPEGTAVLQGTLTKYKNGRKTTESKVKFEVVLDNC